MKALALITSICMSYSVGFGAITDVESQGAGHPDMRLIKRSIASIEKTAERIFEEQHAELSERIKCKVIVYAEENEKATSSSATLETSGNSRSLTGTIHILAPSAYPDGAKSMGGQEKGSDEYTLRLLGHETLSLYLSALSRTRSEGWPYYSAPAWFTQGSQEYLASLCLKKKVREDIFTNYYKHTTIEVYPKITVSNPYSGGLVLMQFIANKYGEEKIFEIISSEASTFDEAFQAALGSQETFRDNFAKWNRNANKPQ